MPGSDTNIIKPVSIGGCTVGPGSPAFIVAEAGVNHDGSVDKAIELVEAAAACGASAIKFQLFRADDLTTSTAPTAGYQKKACGESSQRAMLARLELSIDDFARIRSHCASRSILFMVTPFSLKDVRHATKLDTCAVKIASTDLTNSSLLQAAGATGLPMIVSTGAATYREISDAVTELGRLGVSNRLVVLHCVSSYPAPIEAANLWAIRTLTERLGLPCGLSDHTISTLTGSWAVACGACLLEKHFTFDRGAKGPDHALSLTPDELSEYISVVREAERALGSGKPGMTDLESQVRLVARKSVVSAVDIHAGTTITREMLTLKRPGSGIAPNELERIVGRTSADDIPRDTVLCWDMLR